MNRGDGAGILVRDVADGPEDLDGDAGDLTELSASYAYLMDQLRTGAASAAAGQADKARQNKAPL